MNDADIIIGTFEDAHQYPEKLADVILGNPPLPRSEAKVYIAPNYETSQR